MLTVRLNLHLQKELDAFCERKNCSKSEVVKEALQNFFQKEHAQLSPYELGKDLFGQASSGEKEASSTYKKRIKQKLNEKHSH